MRCALCVVRWCCSFGVLVIVCCPLFVRRFRRLWFVVLFVVCCLLFVGYVCLLFVVWCLLLGVWGLMCVLGGVLSCVACCLLFVE